jgi:hypothetical protein
MAHEGERINTTPGNLKMQARLVLLTSPMDGVNQQILGRSIAAEIALHSGGHWRSYSRKCTNEETRRGAQIV